MKKIMISAFVCAMAAVMSLMACGFVKQSENAAVSAMSVSAMASGTELFKADGTYNVSKAEIEKGMVFSFFGYDWKVVNKSGDTATFWMTSPYKTSTFTKAMVGNDVQTASNTWNNGYTGAAWKGQNMGGSAVSALLAADQNTIIGTKAGSDKVLAGSQAGINEQTYTLTVNDVYYKSTSKSVVRASGSQSVTLNYSIANTAKLWLPSLAEVKDGGIWNLTNADRQFSDTSVSARAWLRTPFEGNNTYDANNCDAIIVGAPTDIDASSITFNYADNSYGVRPAIHLNIKSASIPTDPNDDPTDPNDDPNDDPTAPVDPTDPTEPTDPINPDPTDPVTPTEPKEIISSEVLKMILVIVCVVGALALIIITVFVYRNRAREEALLAEDGALMYN